MPKSLMYELLVPETFENGRKFQLTEHICRVSRPNIPVLHFLTYIEELPMPIVTSPQ